MNHLIIVTGDLAAGKSSFAALLSKIYNIPLFMKDTYKEALSEVFPNRDAKTNKALGRATFLTLESIANDLMVRGASFILESNFKNEELQAIDKLAQKYNYSIRTLWLQGDIKTLHKRYVDRFVTNRHDTHKLNDLRNFSDFENYILSSRNISPLGEVTLIDATTFDYQMIDWDIKV